jgi:hypothetical protein
VAVGEQQAVVIHARERGRPCLWIVAGGRGRRWGRETARRWGVVQVWHVRFLTGKEPQIRAQKVTRATRCRLPLGITRGVALCCGVGDYTGPVSEAPGAVTALIY